MIAGRPTCLRESLHLAHTAVDEILKTKSREASLLVLGNPVEDACIALLAERLLIFVERLSLSTPRERGTESLVIACCDAPHRREGDGIAHERAAIEGARTKERAILASASRTELLRIGEVRLLVRW